MTDRFLLDVMLGKLTVYLRMCGHDAAYALDRDVEADDEILAWAREEDRTLLTRDEQLAERDEGTGGVILLRSREVEAQLRELDDAGATLEPDERPSRCGTCNGRLSPVDERETTPEYAPEPVETAVWRCGDCGQYFWKGSHWDRVEETVREL